MLALKRNGNLELVNKRGLRMKLANKRYYPPGRYPEGWYLVEVARNLPEGGLLQKEWMGRQIVAWRDSSGEVCVSEAYCPHLGAHLGPKSGGRVRNGRLVCPFHGFEYDIGGQCVATPNAPPPRTARLNVYETRELNGLVFAWWSSVGRGPQWELPQWPDDEWSRLEYCRLRFPGHPQETSENSVDINHFQYVHGYHTVKQVGKVHVDGAYLRNKFLFRRRMNLAGVRVLTDVAATTHVWGVGYSFVEFHERGSGLYFRQWILSTPLDDTDVQMVIALQIKRWEPGQKWPATLLLKCLPPGLLPRFFVARVKHDVRQDIAVWRSKRYQPLPILSRADGEIMTYRKYCEQFYPEVDETARPVRSLKPASIYSAKRAAS